MFPRSDDCSSGCRPKITIHSPQRRTSKSMSLGEEHLAYIASELSLKDLKVHNPVTICLLPLHNAQNTYMYSNINQF